MSIAAERLHRITADVYERMGATGLLPERGVELLDGLLVEMSPKGDRHNFAVNSLNAQLNDQRRARYWVNADSLSFRPGAHDEPEPDLAVARATRTYARERPRPDEIALIIEVADTSLAFDLRDKAAKYALARIPEYSVVDLQEDVIHVVRDPGGAPYKTRRKALPGEVLSPTEYLDVTIDVAQVLGQ